MVEWDNGRRASILFIASRVSVVCKSRPRTLVAISLFKMEIMKRGVTMSIVQTGHD